MGNVVKKLESNLNQFNSDHEGLDGIAGTGNNAYETTIITRYTTAQSASPDV
jgi:hypothetical protein